MKAWCPVMTNGRLTQADLDIIERMTLFERLTHADLTKVAEVMFVKLLPPGARLYRPGEIATCLYGILSGWVKITRQSPNGETALLSTYSVGNTIGEAHAALGDRFADSAVCAVECRVFVLSCTDLNKLLSEIPKLQIGLMATVSRHLDEANEDLEILKTLNGEQRLIHFLLELAHYPDALTNVALPFEKILIADQLGMTPESLSRNFAKLRTLGVTVRGRSVQIKSPDKLYERLKKGPRLDADTSA